MIKFRIAKIAIAASLLTSLFANTASADPDRDFSNVDCNDAKMRGLLLETYNDIKSNSDAPTVIDVYDQKKIIGDINKLACHGTYEFSDGDKLNMTFKLYKNSIGQFINSFEPDSDN
ncbi:MULTISPECIES: hypothetical protein [Pseudomonadota]|uniref:hypothetical protein n=1 Tax=Pseudomonadota TaxID=1224 RepID=UPI0005356AC4|nr:MULTISPECIES: hypothetical protein [Pantoea]MDU1575962.1 hypothetical protein [Pantoea sp.]PNK69944.1 hypothetical protein A6J33_003360 [Pantoea sp. FDAARGOS_194]